MEHEAHRLPQARSAGEQARVLNQREHLAHRDTDGWAASDVKRGEHVGRKSASKRTPIASPTACAAAAEALEALLRLTRQEDGRVYRMDGTYSAGSALTQELCAIGQRSRPGPRPVVRATACRSARTPGRAGSGTTPSSVRSRSPTIAHASASHCAGRIG